MLPCVDSLDSSSEDLSGEGTSPLLGSNLGKAFISVKESARGGSPAAAEVLESAWQPGIGLFPG